MFHFTYYLEDWHTCPPPFFGQFAPPPSPQKKEILEAMGKRVKEMNWCNKIFWDLYDAKLIGLVVGLAVHL